MFGFMKNQSFSTLHIEHCLNPISYFWCQIEQENIKYYSCLFWTYFWRDANVKFPKSSLAPWLLWENNFYSQPKINVVLGQRMSQIVNHTVSATIMSNVHHPQVHFVQTQGMCRPLALGVVSKEKVLVVDTIHSTILSVSMKQQFWIPYLLCLQTFSSGIKSRLNALQLRFNVFVILGDFSIVFETSCTMYV